MEMPPSRGRTGPDPQHDASEEAIAWFARLHSERVTDQEREQFESWLRESPAHRRAFHDIHVLWDAPELTEAGRASDRADAPALVPSLALARRPGALRVATAAAVALILIAALFHADLAVRIQADHLTATGERRVVELSDRSTVTLNAQSAIATEFNGGSRRILLLKGEALFQVQADHDRPFLVEHQHLVARAVGTEFLVREEPGGMRVTVVEGVVELAPREVGRPPVRVTAGQQATVDEQGPRPLREIDAMAATAWVRGRLIFNDARLADVIAELRRYHRGVIVIGNRAVGDIRVSGSYTLADPAGVLTALAQTLPLGIVRLTDRVVLLF